MRNLPVALVFSLLLFSTVSPAAPIPGVEHKTPTTKTAVSSDVARAARKLAQAFVDTAAADTLDSLAYRSMAFAGMASGLSVLIDGKRMNAAETLIDNGLVLINNSSHEADAAAILSTVRVLTEIAEGRATRKR